MLEYSLSKLSKMIMESNTPSPNELKKDTKEENTYVEGEEEIQKDHAHSLIIQELKEKAKEEINKLKIENKNLESLSSHRIKYSWWILGFTAMSVFFSLLLMFLSGFKVLEFTENVQIAILTSIAVESIGILYVVAKWLYPKKS